MDKKYLGSSWSKWDLHVHTPASIIEHYGKHKENIWEEFIADLNNLPDSISVLGINDYFFLDGYEIVKQFHEQGKLPKIKRLFPVIELRLKIFGNQSKSDPWHRINFHIIFSDQLQVDTIKSQFISGLSAHFSLLPEDQAYWNGVLNRQSLEDFGKLIIQNSTVGIKETPLEVGFNSLNYSAEGVLSLLQKNNYLRGKHLTAIGKTEWEKLRWDGAIGEKLNIINSANFVFTAAESVGSFHASENALKAQLKEFILLDCSDAHYFSTSLEKDRIGNCNLWIKADPTFEGLKQLRYEPTSRKMVSEVEPRKAHRTIQSIRFNFPDDTKLSNLQSSTEQPFCLTKLKDEIYFSPYFTCIIGGRGAGKSTIINIIAEKLLWKTDFFQNNKIVVEATGGVLKNYDNDSILITGTNEIEFISQGKVEELSAGSQLTELVFNERIKAVGIDYADREKLLTSKFKVLDECIGIVRDLETLNSKVFEKKSILDNDKKIIESIDNETYKNLSKKINETSSQINSLIISKEQYGNFFDSLTTLLLDTDTSGRTDEYAMRLEELKAYIDQIEELKKSEEPGSVSYRISLKAYEVTDRSLENQKNELANFKQQLIDYFTAIGSTPDVISDVDRATSNINIVSNEIAALEVQIQNKEKRLVAQLDQTSDIKECFTECEGIIKTRLEKINDELNIENDNVEKIRFEYQFDKERYLGALNNEFYECFKSYHKPNLSWDNIYWCLNLIEPNEGFLDLSHKQYLRELSEKTFDRNSLYGRVFQEIIEKRSNFDIYKYLVKKHIYNTSETVRILGYYGSSPLTSCSFGQRCTAVVVTLLMTGVKPLLIDEPEAHLDNRLIAEYLVDLIKEKKNERQIIFATHNANFVVNGDAELIHILEIPKGSFYTEITSTTIENLTHRKSLLKLEGGEEAFKKRDKKLLSSIYS